MLRFLIVVAGLALLAFGVYRASTGPRAPLARGAYQHAVQVWATSLLISVVGFTVFVLGASWSALATVAGFVIGGLLAIVGGSILYKGMIRQVQGRG